jgi:type III restriction enzyme
MLLRPPPGAALSVIMGQFDGGVVTDCARTDYRHLPRSSKRSGRSGPGFQHCLYPQQKFDSDSERRFAVICDSDPTVQKWFKPAPNVFRIDYKYGISYEPDFVIETTSEKILCEPKRASEMGTEVVGLKSAAATEWCRHATEYERQNNGKPWRYALIPHDAITSTATFTGLLSQFSVA